MLTVGSPLPQLPLWLGADICVPLDLETTYQVSCTDLRIRLAAAKHAVIPQTMPGLGTRRVARSVRATELGLRNRADNRVDAYRGLHADSKARFD